MGSLSYRASRGITELAKRSAKRLHSIQSDIRRLRRILPFADAVRIACDVRSEGVLNASLRDGETISLRRGTTDLQCFEKVFVEKEYQLPVSIQPHIIVDAGANIGMATLYLHSLFPRARILAIEPEESNFRMLELNCGGLPNVRLVQAALWPEKQAICIEDRNVDKWRFAVSLASEETGMECLPVLTMEDILAEYGRIDLLKLDVEGAEREIFARRPERWLNRVGTIIIELHDRFRPGCANAFFSAIGGRPFRHEVRGENVFIFFAP